MVMIVMEHSEIIPIKRSVSEAVIKEMLGDFCPKDNMMDIREMVVEETIEADNNVTQT